MTDNLMKFMGFVSQNEEAGKELQALLAGLKDVDEQARNDALVKFAAKYGFTLMAEDFKPEKMEEISEDELQAVAGGDDCQMQQVFIDCDFDNFQSAIQNCGFDMQAECLSPVVM